MVHIMGFTVSVIVSFLLSFLALWIRRVKKRFQRTLVRQLRFSDVTAGCSETDMETLNVAVSDLLQINCSTTAVLSTRWILIIPWVFSIDLGDGIFLLISNMASAIYGLSNPFIYSVTMTELRNHFIKMHGRQVTRIAPIVSVISNNANGTEENVTARRVRFKISIEMH